MEETNPSRSRGPTKIQPTDFKGLDDIAIVNKFFQKHDFAMKIKQFVNAFKHDHQLRFSMKMDKTNKETLKKLN